MLRRTKIQIGAADAPGSAPQGQELQSLLASTLGERFYSWRGVSGERYVCAVFTAGEEAVFAAFSLALIIGVARDGAARRPVCVIASRDFESESGRRWREDASAHGVSEWHVHFGATEAKAKDLAASLLN